MVSKKISRFLTTAVLAAIVLATAGCMQAWNVTARRYALSDMLYEEGGTPSAIFQAAEDFRYLVLEVSISAGPAGCIDISDKLRFGLYYASDPSERTENIATDAVELLGELPLAVEPEEESIGSIFFLLSEDTDISELMFRVYSADYEQIYEVVLSQILYVSDYPSSW